MINWTECPIRGINFFSDIEEIKPAVNRKQRRGKKTRKSNNSRPRWKK